MNTQTETTTGKLIEFVSFRLDEEEFVIDIARVQEINRMVEITKLPEVPHYCEGVINLRGKVIPVLDLRRKFDMEGKKWDKNTRIIVCDTENGVFGMIVDEVQEVLRLQSSTIEPAPDIVTSSAADYIVGVAKLDERLLIFLDISRIAAETGKSLKTVIDQCDPTEIMITENSTDTDLDISGDTGIERKATMSSIESIVTKLRKTTNELDKNSNELTLACNGVTDCALATVQAAEHLSGLIGKHAQQAGEVSKTVEETITAFTEAWNSSNSNTERLTELIKTIQAETENARKSVEESIDVVNKGREIAHKAGGSLSNAFNMSQQAMSLIEQIDSPVNKVTTKKKRTRKPVTA